MPNDNVANLDPKRLEALGPAERIVQTLSTFTDHLVHNRPGIVVPDGRCNIGVRWTQATWRVQLDGSKAVFTCTKQGKKTVETRIGTLSSDGKTVIENGAEFRNPGLFPEVAAYLYKQVAEVYRLDADFAAHWASFVFAQDRKDLKTILAAFMLAQSHAGNPVVEGEEVLFYDDDFRAVGEAMILIRQKGADLSPRQLLQIGEVLNLSQVHEINRQMGFKASAKNRRVRRYEGAICKWLRYRERNPKMLEGLVTSGQGSMVKRLAKLARYKPETEAFFQTLRWKQKQASSGHRTLAIGKAVKAAETWAGLTEAEVCQKVVTERPSWLRLVGLIPKEIGITRAILAAAVAVGSISEKELIILTPTLEELGLLTVEPIASSWKKACEKVEDQRARNIARNVKTKEVKEKLEEAADAATAKAIEKVTKNLRVYFIVDKSGSMGPVLDAAKRILSKFVGGFPLERTHVSVFNSVGSEVLIQAPKAAAVTHAFSKHAAGGGTCYGEGVRALCHHQPKPEEDVLFIFAGDEEGEDGASLAAFIQAAQMYPVAFGLLKFGSDGGNMWHTRDTVRKAAAVLGIPCFLIDEAIFEDPYAITQNLVNLIAATPVATNRPVTAAPKRETLVTQILRTPLLARPSWA